MFSSAFSIKNILRLTSMVYKKEFEDVVFRYQ